MTQHSQDMPKIIPKQSHKSRKPKSQRSQKVKEAKKATKSHTSWRSQKAPPTQQRQKQKSDWQYVNWCTVKLYVNFSPLTAIAAMNVMLEPRDSWNHDCVPNRDPESWSGSQEIWEDALCQIRSKVKGEKSLHLSPSLSLSCECFKAFR